MRGYFDYNATVPTRPEVVEAMAAVLGEGLGNPSSMHAHGRRARRHLDQARERVARLLGCASREIVFTSGASESNNLALRGFAARNAGAPILTTAIEHHSILETVKALARSGADVHVLDVDRDGRLDLERLRAHTGKGCALLALGLVNGETGHIADLDPILGFVGGQTIVHLDAAQAVGRVPLRMRDGVHMLALSAHKFGGPWGVGALVVRTDAVEPLVTGGPQERSLRAGTENVAGIVGMGVAAESALKELASEGERLRSLREGLWTRLAGAIRGLLRITPPDGAPGTLTIALDSVASDVVVAGLDLAGFSVSTGSACAAGAPEPSHVMRALGIDERHRNGVIRISMGAGTTAEDVSALAEALVRTVDRARVAA
jgi:cysteine desulfurase